MKRSIRMYIGNELVDLGDEDLILFNWAMEDLSNPTVVKNSYSQQVTLKGTPQNNRIFGESFRTDRRVGYGAGEYTGVGFDPSRKTPFSIYSDLGEVLVSGYVKLDSVSSSGSVVQYTVTLYGGLGSFFYSLSYDDQGNKRTLADLDYLGTEDPDGELDFQINASSVTQAWNELNQADPEGVWTVVNFALCYNGIPDGDFSADKGIVTPVSVGLSGSQPVGNKIYSTKEGGYALVNLAKEHDEWSVKDLRSYLQRPVFSMKAFIDAICRPENNGGYEVDVSSLVNEDGEPMYQDIWMTLPMLTELTVADTDIGAELNFFSGLTSGADIASYTVVAAETMPSNATVSVNVHFKLAYSAPSFSGDSLELHRELDIGIVFSTAIFIQLVAYSGDVVVGGSKVACMSDIGFAGNSYYTPQLLAERSGYVPEYNGDEVFEDVTRQCSFIKNSSSLLYEQDTEIELSGESYAATSFVLHVACRRFFQTARLGVVTFINGSESNTPVLYSGDSAATTSAGMVQEGQTADTITIEVPDAGVRSGATVTKSMLLSSENTPADYLLSFCKLFGFHFLYDSATRKVSIVTRNDLYARYAGNSDVIDLSGRIDMSKDIEIVPFMFSSKWYDFTLESNGGLFYDQYRTLYGIEYGLQRVDTGYEFEADNINLLDGNVLKQGVTALERSAYFNTITVNGRYVPSVFVDKGNTYTLWDDEGNTEEFSISCPPDNAAVSYFNSENNGYDVVDLARLQLHDDDGPVDGAGILVFLSARAMLPPRFHLSDDTPVMAALNDGKPCWNLIPGTGTLYAPVFRRYVWTRQADGLMPITKSLDFGKVKEFFVPGIYYREDTTLYSRYWKNYLSDRFNVNTKMLRCRVDLSGLPVGQDLLRHFFWFDNGLWVLNSITNYSFTTYDTAECEFVQVQQKMDYTVGQTIK